MFVLLLIVMHACDAFDSDEADSDDNDNDSDGSPPSLGGASAEGDTTVALEAVQI